MNASGGMQPYSALAVDASEGFFPKITVFFLEKYIIGHLQAGTWSGRGIWIETCFFFQFIHNETSSYIEKRVLI
jgi:hypothetical protein